MGSEPENTWTQQTTGREINTPIPAELFQKIFGFACARSGDPLQLGEFVPVDRRVRHAITATCRIWREVALGTSSLWCRIEAYQKGGKERPSTLLRLDIERAGTRPLIIRARSFDPKKTMHTFSILRSAVDRCQSLCLDVSRIAAFDYFLDPPDGNYASLDLPLLHTFFLRCIPVEEHTPRPGRPLDHIIILDLSRAPQLSQLVFHAWGSPVRIQTTSFTNLVSLELVHTSDVGNDIVVFQACPKLHDLRWSFDYADISESHVLQLAHTEFPSLRLLWYDATDLRPFAEDNMLLLHSLRAPNLTELFLEGEAEAIPTYNQFPNLRHVSVFKEDLGYSVPDIIRNVPSIVKLSIWTDGWYPSEIEVALSQQEDNGRPKLAVQLEEVTMHLNSAEIGEAIIQLRNHGLPEGPEMPFVFHLVQGEEVSEEIEAWRQQHPFSVDCNSTKVERPEDRSWFVLASSGY